MCVDLQAKTLVANMISTFLDARFSLAKLTTVIVMLTIKVVSHQRVNVILTMCKTGVWMPLTL